MSREEYLRHVHPDRTHDPLTVDPRTGEVVAAGDLLRAAMLEIERGDMEQVMALLAHVTELRTVLMLIKQACEKAIADCTPGNHGTERLARGRMVATVTRPSAAFNAAALRRIYEDPTVGPFARGQGVLRVASVSADLRKARPLMSTHVDDDDNAPMARLVRGLRDAAEHPKPRVKVEEVDG